ncbi:MAG: nucleoside-diphosphate kinase [Labilithrix sp.]|nr:nucleoside-diphosphate kinase [Labilithrix sp.]MBX3221863.1 nucleoside-diphosphate kinase [Labilithrix sp.]
MAVERTLSIIKPDAVEKNKAGAILALLEESGFKILACKRTHLSRQVAEGFYAVHKARPFFGELVEFMTRSPVFVAVLERDDAVAQYRKVMGATDPAKADAGTIRKLYGGNVGENAVHGSDSLDNAKIEIAYFFPANEVAPAAG